MRDGLYTRLYPPPPGYGNEGSRKLHILLLLVREPVENVGIEHCKIDLCVFCRIVESELSLMVGVHLYDIIVPGHQGGSGEVFCKVEPALLGETTVEMDDVDWLCTRA